MADTFSKTVANASGYATWSNTKNWSGGLPNQNSAVTFSGSGYTSLIDLSVTIGTMSIAAGVTLLEAANKSLTVSNGTTMATGAEYDIATNSYLSTASLTGGDDDTIAVGTNAILTVANGMSFGSNTSFSTGASTGSGYVYSSFLTLGADSTLTIGDRLALQNGLVLGQGSSLVTAGATADLEIDRATFASAVAATFGAGTVAIRNGLVLGTGDSVTAAAGVAFGAGSATLASGATLDLEGGTALAPSQIATVTPNGGTLIVGGDTQVGTAAGGSYVVQNGGTLEITQSVSGASAFSLRDGLVALDSSVNIASGTSFAFSGHAGELETSGINNFTQVGFGYAFGFAITGFDYGDVLRFPPFSFIGDTATCNTTAGTIVVKSLFGTTVLTVANVSFAADVGKNASILLGCETITLVCFLDGTLIDTPHGPRTVESLEPGDEVVTIENGARVARTARWVGRRSVDLDGIANAHELHPVRIRAGAFADAIPTRDLLVTPDHCILVEGGLVPARMLVNGGSIVSETAMRRFAVNHVELDRHAILLSEGLTTESYLDTGNRHGFGTRADDATAAPLSWADAAAPLTTAREVVEPIWQRLAARARMLGLATIAADADTSADARLRIRLQDGTSICAARRRGDRHFFVLPAGTTRAAIVSRVFVPARIAGPFVDDRRRLGVAVSAATLWKGLRSEALALDGARPGWHAGAPGDASIWTDGAGVLDTGPLDCATMLELTLTLAPAYLPDLSDLPAPARRAA